MKLCPTCKRPLTFGKTHEQRKLFHAICTEIGRELGHTPGQIKEAIKAEHFGLDEVKIQDKWYRMVKSSEDTDRMEYSELIETALRMGAEWGVVILETRDALLSK
jgi:predicted transcriptional regulator